MSRPTDPVPTDRELAILKVLWEHGEATVRQVYEVLRNELPIVQNTVQAFLRTMTEKGLVTHRTEGRSFVYRAAVQPEATRNKLLDRVLQRAYDGALDRLVEGAIGLRKPSREELDRLRELLERLEKSDGERVNELTAILDRHGGELALALTLVVGAGALGVVCGRSPVHRHRVAELTLGLASLAVVLLLLPLPRLGARWWESASGAILRAETTAAPATARAAEVEEHWVPLLPAEIGELAVHDASGAGTTVLPLREPPAERDLRFSSLFLLGAAAYAAHLVLSLLLLRRTLRRATPAPGWVADLIAEPDGAAPPVLVAGREGRPFCCGLGRGRIVIPPELVRPGLEARLEAVLRHEAAHLAQRHPRGRLLAALAAPFLYWNPLYWWLARQLRHSAELLADDMAVGGIDKRRYVEELLELANDARRPFLPQVSRLGVLGPRRDFLERMETLLMRRSRLATRTSSFHVLARGLAACILLGSVSLAWGRSPQDPGADPFASDELESLDALGYGDASTAATDDSGSLRLRVAFEIRDARALGEFLIHCADEGIAIDALSVGERRRSGQRTGRVTVSGTSVESVTISGVDGLTVIALEVMNEAPAAGARRSQGRGAAAVDPGFGDAIGLGSGAGGGARGGRAQGGAGGGVRGRRAQGDGAQGGVGGVQGSTEAGGGGRRGGAFGGSRSGLSDQAFAPGATSLGADAGTQDLRGELDRLQQQVRDLTELYRVLLERLDADGGGAPTRDDFRAPGPEESIIEGTVLETAESVDGPLVRINRGTDDGVSMGMTFEVFRGAAYKGQVRVTNVADNHCTGIVLRSVSGQRIEVSDSVTNQL